MIHRNCLNCEKELTDHYCSRCGQKADTHRITFKNFILHDILHGTFHIDKGILFTTKQALMRPGKASLDYISGKRKPYYNVFYLILIVLGLILFFLHFNDQLYVMQGGTGSETKTYLNENSKTFDELISQKSKIIIILFVPLSALNSFILFRRKKLNLSEHFIIAGMILLGMLLISFFGNIFFYLDLIVPFNETFSFVMSWFISLLIIFHVGYGYYNAFGSDYSKWVISYKIVLFYLLLFLEISLLFIIVFGFISDWKFGIVSLSPFG
jgi:hypothetical protein